jgi:hypothetical protein
MTPRDGFPRFSARSAWRGDAGHRVARATPSESLGKPPFRSRGRTAGGRRKALPMSHIARGFPPYPADRPRDLYGSSSALLGISIEFGANMAGGFPSRKLEYAVVRPSPSGCGEWEVGSGGGDYPVAEDFESPCDPPWPRVLANSLSRLPSNTCRREALGRPPHGRFLARAHTPSETRPGPELNIAVE